MAIEHLKLYNVHVLKLYNVYGMVYCLNNIEQAFDVSFSLFKMYA